MPKTKCGFCEKREAFPLTCKSCQTELCVKCYNPEKHSCSNLDKFILNKKLQLNSELLKSECKSVKMEKI